MNPLDNMDTPTKAVQKAVHTLTLNFAPWIRSFFLCVNRNVHLLCVDLLSALVYNYYTNIVQGGDTRGYYKSFRL